MSKHNQNDTYLKICVLQNNKPDYQDEALQQREVKEIFANHRQLNFDIEHNHNYLSGIDIIENYISKTEEKIKDTPIPSGSWIMTLNITNPTILNGLRNGTIKGVSLETDFTEDLITHNTSPVVPYKDIVNKEEMIPHVVSFTSSPANQLPVEVMTHKQYTRKSKKYMDGENMTHQENNEKKNNEEDIGQESELGFLRRIFAQHFTQHTSKNMATPVSQPTTNTGFNTEELINSLIQTQKMMPSITKTLDAVASSQTQMTESFNNLNLKFEEFIMKQSTDKLEEEEDTKNSTKSTTTDNPEDTEDQEDISGKTGTNNQEENTTETTPENTTPSKEDDPNEENDQKEDVEDEKKQHTKKNKPITQRPPTFQTTNKENPAPDNYIKFLYNRSYENFMKQ